MLARRKYKHSFWPKNKMAQAKGEKPLYKNDEMKIKLLIKSTLR